MLRVQIMLFLAVWGFFRPQGVIAEDKAKVAVLPFRVYSLKPLDHLKLGLQEMLTSRMAKRGLSMISPKVINRHALAFLPQLESKDLMKIGEDIKVRWVLAGSVTQIGKRLSVDLKVADVTKKRPPFLIYMVAEDIDALEETAQRIATSVDHQISGVPQVDSIRVEGNERIEKEAILAVVMTKPGDRIDYDRLDKDLRDIYKMGFFEDVKTRTEEGARGKIVIFNVTEKPSIGKIVFSGNKRIEDSDLRKEVGIKLYTILDHNEIRQSVNRLRDYYRQKAYYNVDIEERIEPLPNNEVLLKYEIEEHEKVYVEKIQFLGNNKYNDRELKKLMETNEKGFFSWITDSGHLDRKKLDFDVHKITSFYHNNGFVKTRVGEPKISYEKDKGLVITIEIEEGQQYSVEKVDVEGDLIRPDTELLEKVQISKEKVFNREIVRKDVLALRTIYSDEGYAHAEVTPSIREDDKASVVDITYKISKGQKVRFERINITGNTVTRDKVIRRELKLVEGEYFSGRALKRSTENLHRLGFFEDVEVRTKKGSQDDLMVLNVNVKEKPTGSFSIGAGYSSVDQAIALFQVAQNNLFGYGQKLSASARLGGASSEFDIRFIEPWLFDKPLSAGIDAYKWEREYDEYTKDSLGTALSFGFPLGIGEFTRGSVKYAYDDAEITDVAETASLLIKDMKGRNVTSSATFAIQRDSKDRPWNTSKGSVNRVSFEYGGGFLGGDVYFNRYIARSAWYFPMFWDTVFVVQGRAGYVKQRSGGKLPVYQKFRIGGINTVRGFDYASISPLDPQTLDRIGGEKMMVFNLEYRFPLLKEQGIVGLVFFDAGNVFTKDEDYGFSDIRKSAGAGFRWYSPIGPLRLEYGRNLDPRAGEKSGNWEFTVGGFF